MTMVGTLLALAAEFKSSRYAALKEVGSRSRNLCTKYQIILKSLYVKSSILYVNEKVCM